MRQKIRIHWTRPSVEHISKHSVKREEVERAVNGSVFIRSTARKGQKLKLFIGGSFGRVLFVVLRPYAKVKGEYEVVSARDAKESEKRLYKRRGK